MGLEPTESVLDSVGFYESFSNKKLFKQAHSSEMLVTITYVIPKQLKQTDLRTMLSLSKLRLPTVKE